MASEHHSTTSRSTASSPSSTKSKPGKKSLKSLFQNRKRSSIFSSATSSTQETSHFDLHEDDDLSSEDERNYSNSYNAENDPLCFKSSVLNHCLRKVSHGTNNLNNPGMEHPATSIDLLDEDYTKYLKQPKYIKTFKKSLQPMDISKRLFLAQELNQNLGSEDKVILNDVNRDSRDGHDIVINSNDSFQLNYDTASSTDDTLFKNHVNGSSTGTNKNSIWAMKFSLDGKYLATAGKNTRINIWKVMSSPIDRIVNNNGKKDEEAMYAPVFLPLPSKVFKGHTHDVLSLDWSKNNFLLTGSMDKTVKLWNLKHDKPLRTFIHGDFVTSVKFHPTDDRFFVSGCLDHKVRLWSIIDDEVSFEFDAKDLVTAIGFTPNGNLVIAGTFSGMVYFLDTLTLELRHSVELNKMRSNISSKITGIETFVDDDDIKVLITSNDSRVRLLSLRHRRLECYFKGLSNQSSQIIATVSDDNQYIISGSENHWVYVWKTHKDEHGHMHDPFKKLIANKKKRNDYTSFHAHHSIVTCALVAPMGTARALTLSNDIIYELNADLERRENGTASTVNTPLFNKDFIGSIIVSADEDGVIRIFRQDFASNVRKSLLDEGKRRKNSENSVTIITNAPLKDESKLYNNNKNQSASSLLTRGYSFRKNGTADEERRGRSRNGTVNSLLPSIVQDRGAVCDVCGGDKFSVLMNDDGQMEGRDRKVGVFCKDCGNQINS